MAAPDVILEIAFGIDPLVNPTAGQWVDVTTYLKSFSGGPGGRQRDLDRVEAGTMTFILDNGDGRFDPLNATGPHFGNIKPNVQVRFRTATSAVFRGYVDGWPQSYTSNGFDAEVRLSCTDAFKILANIDLPDSLWEMELRETANLRAWWRLGDRKTDILLSDSSDNDHHASFQGTLDLEIDGLIAFDGNTSVQFPDSAAFIVPPLSSAISGSEFTVGMVLAATSDGGGGEVIFGQHDGSNPSGSGLVYWVLDAGGAVRCSVRDAGGELDVLVSTATIIDGEPHHVLLRKTATTVELYIDATLEASAAHAGTSYPATAMVIGNDFPPSNSASERFEGTVDEVYFVDRALSSGEIAAHSAAALTPFKGSDTDTAVTRVLDYIGWPSALRDVADGVSTLQAHGLGGKVLEHLQQLDRTEGGLLYVAPDGKIVFRGRDALLLAPGNASQLTFGHGATETPFIEPVIEYDDTNIYTRARMAREGGTAFEIENAAAVTARGPRGFDGTDFLSETDADVIDRGNWIVRAFSDARVEIRAIAVNLNHPSVTAADVLDLRVGDLVTVRHVPRPGELANEFTCRVGQMTHDGQPGKQWKVTLQLSPWDDEKDQPWILGDATYGVLGSTTKLGF